MPETSIIIVSYNGLHETTAPCLESIFTNDDGSDFEVIVVDNNSSDGTVACLSDMMKREPRLKCIFNESNRGFAGGNNVGIKAASGEFLVLLNSDTLVTKGWLGGLIKPLSDDPSIGLVGPVSNKVGTEQMIFTSGETPEEILQEGLLWTERSRGSRFETEMLCFFCVATRRDVIEKVGVLDEDFELGYCEDDDYSLRVRSAGYRLVCAEEVFVYHKGGGSFGVDAARMSLLERNRERFRKKHPGRHGTLHPYGWMKIIEGYIDVALQTGMSADLQYRIENRMKTFESYRRPRRLRAKIKFCFRLRRLRSSLGKCGYCA